MLLQSSDDYSFSGYVQVEGCQKLGRVFDPVRVTLCEKCLRMSCCYRVLMITVSLGTSRLRGARN